MGAADERRAALGRSLIPHCGILPFVALRGIMFLCLPRPLPTASGVSGMPCWAPPGSLVGSLAVACGPLFVDKSAAGPSEWRQLDIRRTIGGASMAAGVA